MECRVLATIYTIFGSLRSEINLSSSVFVQKLASSDLACINISWRMSQYNGHSIRTWSSSSTLSWHIVHTRSPTSSLVLSYLPVSILRGATPHLNLANADLLPRDMIHLAYSSVLYSCLNNLYVLSLFLPWPLMASCMHENDACVIKILNKSHQTIFAIKFKEKQ